MNKPDDNRLAEEALRRVLTAYGLEMPVGDRPSGGPDAVVALGARHPAAAETQQGRRR